MFYFIAITFNIIITITNIIITIVIIVIIFTTFVILLLMLLFFSVFLCVSVFFSFCFSYVDLFVHKGPLLVGF